LGYDIAVSTDGYGEDSQGNPKTTSIIVIDGAMSKHGEEVNYYTGLRNIDSYFKANGVIGFNENEILSKLIIYCLLPMLKSQSGSFRVHCITVQQG
jgi:hypothetical protein